MGMDVYGRQPTNKSGEYFRANIWSWRPIHELIFQLCTDLIDEQTMMLLGSNDGAGPEDQATCTEMANRFDQWMEHNVDGLIVESDNLRVKEDGTFVSKEELEENPYMPTSSAFSISDDHLKEWIEFLRHCGGFQVC